VQGLDYIGKTRREHLYRDVVATVERPLLEKVLAIAEGNQLKAAQILGINRNTLRAKLKKLNIDAQRFKNEKYTHNSPVRY